MGQAVHQSQTRSHRPEIGHSLPSGTPPTYPHRKDTDQLPMLAERTGDLLHGFDAGPLGLAAPLVEELAGPSRRVGFFAGHVIKISDKQYPRVTGKCLDTDTSRPVVVAQRCGRRKSADRFRAKGSVADRASNHLLPASGFNSALSLSRGSHLPLTITPLGCFRVSKFSS